MNTSKLIVRCAFEKAKEAFIAASMKGGLWEQVEAAILAYKTEYERAGWCVALLIFCILVVWL